MVSYCLFKKSCTNATGYLPVRRSVNIPVFDAPVYLGNVIKYRKQIQTKTFYTLSKGGKHLTSLYQSKPGHWFFGDAGNDALLVLLEGMQMEIFVFQNQRHLAEALCIGVDGLPLEEVRRQAKPVNTAKYERQLVCYQGKQISFLG